MMKQYNPYYNILSKISDALKMPSLRIASMSILFFIIIYFLVFRHNCPADLYFHGSSAECEELLSALGGALITIVTTSFSITLLLLQLASTQFSPRLIRMLIADKSTQHMLGAFIFFIASIYLLKIWLHNDATIISGSQLLFINVFLYLCVLMIAIALPYFVNYIADSINAASISNSIAYRVLNEVEKYYEPFSEDKISNELLTKTQIDNYLDINFKTINFGYLQEIDYDALLEIKEYKNLHNTYLAPNGLEFVCLKQLKIIGNFITGGVDEVVRLKLKPINENYNLEKAKSQILADEEISKLVAKAFPVFKFRSIENDINLGIRQLVDIALKAISPAVNDPTTAMNCLDYLGVIICKMSTYDFPSQKARHLATKGILAKEYTFKNIVDLAINQIYHYGRHDANVTIRVLQILEEALSVAQKPEIRAVLKEEIQEIINDQKLRTTADMTQEELNRIAKAIERIKP